MGFHLCSLSVKRPPAAFQCPCVGSAQNLACRVTALARKVSRVIDFGERLGPLGASPQIRRARASHLAANGQAQ